MLETEKESESLVLGSFSSSFPYAVVEEGEEENLHRH